MSYEHEVFVIQSLSESKVAYIKKKNLKDILEHYDTSFINFKSILTTHFKILN